MGWGQDHFGADDIPWFNGGLFKEIDVPELQTDDVLVLAEAASENWRFIDAAIFGTLFERGLDPSKRAQLGAHYTDPGTIQRLLEPAIRRPLLTEWESMREHISTLLSKRDYIRVRAKGTPSKTPQLREKFGRLRTQANEAEREAKTLFSSFLHRLSAFRVLDPACGSGNFLYMALKCLKDIEHLVNLQAEELGLERQLSVTGPHNVLGIETNEFASELAKVTVWIGELQWLREHGYMVHETPILQPLDHIQTSDALLSSDGGVSTWPDATVIVGNPPFLGDKRMRAELGDEYTSRLRDAYKGRVPGGADLVCYWFEKALRAVEGGAGAAALVGTNSIRGGKNRKILDEIVARSRIVEAWSDEPWVNEGADVRVSLVCFGSFNGPSLLDGKPVGRICADLTGHGSNSVEADLTRARRLSANEKTCFIGGMKKGSFDVPGETARAWLSEPNPNSRPNSDVLRPWINGLDLVRRPSDTWIIDFPQTFTHSQAALYEKPFKHVLTEVKPARDRVRNSLEKSRWWVHGRTAPEMRTAVRGLQKMIVTPRNGRHRIFLKVDSAFIPDGQVVVIAREDDATLGILQSRFHELWSLRVCTWLGIGNDPRYTPTTCFETFPFPCGLTPTETRSQATELWQGACIPAGLAPSLKPKAGAVAVAAKRLYDLREQWLNPQEWTSWKQEVIPLGMTVSPYPDRLEPRPGLTLLESKALQSRTLTNLYNETPDWLRAAHDALDSAVAAAYGWDYSSDVADEELLTRLLQENHNRENGQKLS